MCPIIRGIIQHHRSKAIGMENMGKLNPLISYISNKKAGISHLKNHPKSSGETHHASTLIAHSARSLEK